jgi:hypothetical protein
MDRPDELRRLRDKLWSKFEHAEGSGAAALGLQIRILSVELERIEATEVSKADELAARRKTQGGTPRAPSRRRESRGSAPGD